MKSSDVAVETVHGWLVPESVIDFEEKLHFEIYW